MTYIYFLLFVFVTTLHLYGSHKNNANLRNSTKGMILLAIMGMYLACVPEFSWMLIAALLTSWLGDILLIPKGVKWFTAGGISFMISHLCFIAAYCQEIIFDKVPLLVMIVFIAGFAVAVSIIFSHLKQYLLKPLVVPMFAYLMINGLMNCFALFRLISCPCLPTAVTAIGAILFFISDTSLFFVRFNKDSVMKTHFIVMLTYSLGEFLIMLGFML